MAELVQIAGSVLICVCAAMAIASAVVYGLWARWWTSVAGRHLFSFTSVLAGGLTLWSVRLIGSPTFTTAEPGAWPYIRLAAFTPFAWVIAWRLVLIIRAQYAERARRRDHDRRQP
ncbi:hypothetical protein MF672_010945 [Actinomadura sp. ATCC 31491]|uniref:Integral membrane protein n=1 Tax=Actinomadura luzonensis TaxID=2805427 RepID=A0ABT0FPU1_9ACTN|nr:hypothetical protein [Actinomadura luzonensis]MCK2214304.1 hypothetical protein [Actinomadura luzonensis]